MSDDERLAAMLTDLTQQARDGGTPDLDAATRDHPHLATELRQLWTVAQFADLAKGRRSKGKEQDSDNTIELSRDSSAELAPRPLPLAPDFEFIRELGRGGMGVVYLARQKSLNRRVALKMVREAHLASDADRARFKVEAEAAARLTHPNIVPVYEFSDAAGQAYFCMEYVDGPTLSQVVAQQGPLPLREAARILAAIARAVQHAHEQGILHRDLKPSNILLEGARGQAAGVHEDSNKSHDQPRPKVTDFGLAKRIDGPESLTRTGAVVGTPSYMAPEQASSRKDVTAAADVYSLGAILYEMLTGRPPFQTSNPVDTIMMVIEQDAVPPRDLNPSVDRDLELICLKCLQKPPGLRYATAAALADDLDAYLAGESVSTRPSNLGYVVARLLRETHHAEVLENWGALWMWHSLMIFLLCLLTQIMQWRGVQSHTWYLALWIAGLAAWGSILWRLRRRAGPVLFVERQVAHAWAAGVAASIMLFLIEVLGQLPVLTLSPALAVAAGMVIVFQAGILSGQFYLYALLCFLAAAVMPLVPDYSVLLFGIVSAVSFFFPGLKYYRQRRGKLTPRPDA